MKVIDRELLKRFQSPGPCEVCGKPCSKREGHHIFHRGSGQVDIAENLVSVGASHPFPQCPCHSTIHGSGKPSRDELLAIAARRENTTPEAITEKVYRLRRETKCKVWKIS